PCPDLRSGIRYWQYGGGSADQCSHCCADSLGKPSFRQLAAANSNPSRRIQLRFGTISCSKCLAILDVDRIFHCPSLQYFRYPLEFRIDLTLFPVSAQRV